MSRWRVVARVVWADAWPVLWSLGWRGGWLGGCWWVGRAAAISALAGTPAPHPHGGIWLLGAAFSGLFALISAGVWKTFLEDAVAQLPDYRKNLAKRVDAELLKTGEREQEGGALSVPKIGEVAGAVGVVHTPYDGAREMVRINGKWLPLEEIHARYGRPK